MPSPLRSLTLLVATGLACLLPIGIAADPAPDPTPATDATPQTAVFGMGCFWCAQALFEKFKGVTNVVCGYAGGHTENPTYPEVCGGQTGHAEVVQVTYDPAKISYQQLLDIFWDVHDPTTLDAQGPDTGTQYRSIILYETPEQKDLAEASKKAEAAKLHQTVTTEIVPLKTFYPAEAYHQHYFARHPNAPYCVYEISPKIQKLEAHPPEPLKAAQ